MPVLLVLTLALARAVLYGNVALSFLVLSTKKRCSNFVKRFCVFQKIRFKVFWKQFSFFRNVQNVRWVSHRILLISQTEGYSENAYCHFSEKPTVFLLGLKWKLYKKCLSVYLINHIFQISILFNMRKWNL